MSNRTRSILIVTFGVFLLCVGVITSILLIRYYNAKSTVNQQQPQPVKSQVVVVNHDLKMGVKISSADVAIQEIPVDVVPRNAVTTIQGAIGKFVKSDMIQGQMVLENNLADPTNNNQDIGFILSNEHVLLAFPADDRMSRENIIQRGDIIDIFASFQEIVNVLPNTTTSTNLPATTEIISPTPVVRDFTVDAFQKVSVTAIVLGVVTDQSGNNTSKISSYLLALKPQDALVLKHLLDQGAKFDIVLRAPTSVTQFDLTPVTEEFIIELYGLEVLP